MTVPTGMPRRFRNLRVWQLLDIAQPERLAQRQRERRIRDPQLVVQGVLEEALLGRRAVLRDIGESFNLRLVDLDNRSCRVLSAG